MHVCGAAGGCGAGCGACDYGASASVACAWSRPSFSRASRVNVRNALACICAAASLPRSLPPLYLPPSPWPPCRSARCQLLHWTLGLSAWTWTCSSRSFYRITHGMHDSSLPLPARAHLPLLLVMHPPRAHSISVPTSAPAFYIH